MDCRSTLNQLAFVLRSVARDVSEITEVSSEIAERLRNTIRSLEAKASEFEEIAATVEFQEAKNPPFASSVLQ